MWFVFAFMMIYIYIYILIHMYYMLAPRSFFCWGQYTYNIHIYSISLVAFEAW